jgi:hypothetical protein
MRKNLLLKAAVCGVILLFVGTTVSGISDISKKSNNNPLALLVNGLEGYWTFNDQNNLGFDNSGNNHQGIAYGATWTSSGKVKGATSYNGQGYIAFNDFTSSDSQGTVTAWVKQSLQPGQWGLIYAEGSQGANKPYIALGFQGGELIYARDIKGTYTNYQGKLDVEANDGQWHFVAFTCDGSTNRFYFDGNEVFLTWQDGNVPPGLWFSSQTTDTNSIGLCNRPDHWGYFTGTIDEVRIYNRALSDTELGNLYTILLESTLTGGLGINLNVKNVGTATATNVGWNLWVTGGAFGKINVEKNGTISSIAAGGKQKVKSGMFFGLGTIQIQMQVGDEIETATGSQYFIFTKINK